MSPDPVQEMGSSAALRVLGIEPVADPAVLMVTLSRRTDIPPEFHKNVF